MRKDLLKLPFAYTERSEYFNRINPLELVRLYASFRGAEYMRYMGRSNIFFEDDKVGNYSCTECGFPAKEHYTFRENGSGVDAVAILRCSNPECENYTPHRLKPKR